MNKMLPFITMDDDIPPLPDYAAELEAEIAFGPLPYTSEEGIRHMTARIAGLEKELAEMVAAQASPTAIRAALIRSLIKQRADARRRLAEYQLQHESRN